MTDELAPTPADLARAEESASRVRAHAGWLSTYLALFAAGWGALTVIVGLTRPVVLFVAMPIWLVFVAVMAAWTFRQRATLRGATRRMMPAWIASTVIYTVSVWMLPKDRPAIWIAAGLLVATPLAIAAVRERRA